MHLETNTSLWSASCVKSVARFKVLLFQNHLRKIYDLTSCSFGSSWNIEFANIYPQYSRQAINRLEMVFVKEVKWDLYISTTTYAKYYFAIRSLTEKQDFRR